MTTPYFATLDGDELLAACKTRIDNFETDLKKLGDLDRMNSMALAYYGEDWEGHSTSRTDAAGPKGEQRVLKANHLRTVIQNKLTLALSDPPDMMPVPVNTDNASITQAELGKGVIEYYLDDQSVYEELRDAAEMTECLGWSWLAVSWDKDAGEVVEKVPVLDETGQPAAVHEVHEGDVRCEAILPIDGIFDLRTRRKKQDWVIVRTHRNKHDLAAEVEAAGPIEGDTSTPEERAAEIRGLRRKDDTWFRILLGNTDAKTDSDEIEVYELRHLPTPAVPGGRLARMAGTSVLLESGPLPYKDLFCYRLGAGQRFGTAREYTSSHDMLGLQIAIDVLTSIPYSNERAFGGNVLWAPEGSGLRAEKIKQGLSVLYSNNPQMKPEVLQLLRTAPELFSFRTQLVGEQGNIAGMDALSMGRDERQLSGAAMALLDSRTQRAVSSLTKRHDRCLQETCNAILWALGQFGKGTRKLPLILGKVKAPRLMDVDPADLRGVDRVKVQRVSSLQRVPSGRLEMAKDLLASRGPDGKPAINAQQYVAVVETGKFEPLTEGPMAELQNIRAENERLLRGEVLEQRAPLDPMTGQPLPGPDGMPVEEIRTALPTDNPFTHVPEHLIALASPEIRANPQLVGNVLAHVQAHKDAWINTDPMLLALLGIPPPPVPPPALGPPASPGHDGAVAAEGGPPPAERGPSMPTNKATGEKWSPTGDVAHG